MVNKYYVSGYVQALSYVNNYIDKYLKATPYCDEEIYNAVSEIQTHVLSVQENYVNLFNTLKDKPDETK